MGGTASAQQAMADETAVNQEADEPQLLAPKRIGQQTGVAGRDDRSVPSVRVWVHGFNRR